MSGAGETISVDLARFFERKLLELRGGKDTIRTEPEGYRMEYDEQTSLPVYRHRKTGLRIAADPIDLAERVDFRYPQGPTRIVFCYTDAAVPFGEVARLARTEPRIAMRKLVEHGVLSAVGDAVVDEGINSIALALSSTYEKVENPWYGPATSADPAEVERRITLSVQPGSDNGGPWCGAAFVVALHVPRRDCRPARDAAAKNAGSSAELLLEIRAPAPELDREFGVNLIETAHRRDADGLRVLLAKKADPNFQDARGWTALHEACSVRPSQEVLAVLLAVCDVCPLTHDGELPLDFADAAGYEDVAAVLREKMRTHRKGKHLI